MCGFIFLAEIDLASPCLDHLYCVGANLSGYCVMSSKATEEEAGDNFRWRERWRFFEEELDFREVAKQSVLAESATGAGWSADLGVADTAYSRWFFREGGVPLPGGHSTHTVTDVCLVF